MQITNTTPDIASKVGKKDYIHHLRCAKDTQQTISASQTDIRTNGEGTNQRTSRRTNHEIKYADAQIHTSASSRTPGKQPDGEGSIARDRANSQRGGRQAAQGASKQPEVGRQAASEHR